MKWWNLHYLILAIGILLCPKGLQCSDTEPYPMPYGSDLQFSTIFGSAPGVDSGYSKFQYSHFLEKGQPSSLFPFYDFQARVFHNGDVGAGVGVGARFYSPTLPIVWGVNAFHDFRSYEKDLYNQLSFGTELFGLAGFDLSLNGYLALTSKKTVCTCSFFYPEGDYVVEKTRKNIPLSGTTLNIGKTFSLNAAVSGTLSVEGYYYYGNFCCSKNLYGGKASSTWVFYMLKGTLSVYHDNVYGTNVQGELALVIPFGAPFEEKVRIKNRYVNRNDNILLRTRCYWKTNY